MQKIYNPHGTELTQAPSEDDEEPTTPERRLMSAMLTRAIMDASGFTKDVPAFVRHEALEWIKDRNPYGRFSFDWICSHLNFDSETMRAKILGLHTNNAVKKSKEINCFFPQDDSIIAHGNGESNPRTLRPGVPEPKFRSVGRGRSMQLQFDFRVERACTHCGGQNCSDSEDSCENVHEPEKKRRA